MYFILAPTSIPMNSLRINKQDIKALLVRMKQIICEAGQYIMDIYARGFSVAEKSDHTPITETDFAAHRITIKDLQALTQNIPGLSEEHSALKSCLLVESKTAIYARLGSTSGSDAAAAQIIVKEADGQITNTQMQPLCYNTREKLLNRHFFASENKSRCWSKYL